ncbi:MAG TPA: PAS domain S-box protein [Bacteroidota bacterium]
MPSSEDIELLRAVVIGAVVFFALGGALVMSVVLNQRRRIASQRKSLDELARKEQALIAEVAERKQIERALRESQVQYRNLVENISEMYCILDQEYNIVYGSPNLFTRSGYGENVLIGTPFSRLTDHRDRQRVMHLFDESTRRGAVDTTCEFRLQPKNGMSFWVEQTTRIERNDDGEIVEYRSLLRDVSERKRAEEVFRNLSSRIIEAQESERRRVARDLHDGINQILSSIQFRLKSTEEKDSTKKNPLVKEIGEARLLLEEAIQEVRRISQNLRPSILDDLGLIAAVRSVCEEFVERNKIKVDTEFAGVTNRLPDNIELVLFRTVQEALNNIEKHSAATHVDLHLVMKDSYIEALIRDNGKGFDSFGPPDKKKKHRGLGLDGMKERVTYLGGTVEVTSKTHKGTEILVQIPCSTNSNGRH